MKLEEDDTTSAEKPVFRKKRRQDRPIYTGDNASDLLGKTVGDTDQLYAYNVTSYKVKELISEAMYSPSQQSAVRHAFTQLKDILLQAKHVDRNDLKAQILTPKAASLDSKLLSDCTFLPPVSADLCGSFVTGLSLCTSSTFDVRLIIPKKFYRQKDYLNQAWLVKKAYYAAVLVHHILAHKSSSYGVVYARPTGNPLDIEIHIICPDYGTFRVLLHTEEGVFNQKRLLPLVNNVRPEHVGLPASPESLSPTPLYNHTLATNQLYGAGEELTADWVSARKVVKECMMLTRIWIHQRQIDEGFQCVTAFIVRMFMIYLLKNRLLAFHTTAHQIFIAFLQKLVSFDWSKPFSLKEDTTPEQLAEHEQASEIVFLDPTGLVNYCAAVSNESLEQLKHHAKETVFFILRDTDGSFHDTFIKKLPAHLYYDYAITLNNASLLKCTEDNRLIDSCGDELYSALPKVIRVLRRGLGDRVVRMAISPIVRQSVSVHDAHLRSDLVKNRLIIWFHINLDTINNVLERGPPADDPSAEDFRQFWGEMSNLRRFMDGAICEAVVWPGETVGAKRLIYSRLVSYILQRHCQIQPANVVHGVNQLDQCLWIDSFRWRRDQEGTGEEEAASFQSTFFNLTKQIRAIKSLPLSVTDVLGMDAGCRNTKMFASLTSKAGRDMFEPQRILCVVEGSKWPDSDDLQAIDTLKMLMLLKMNEALDAEDNVTSFIREGSLTVLKDGHQFDLRIRNVGELIRLRQNHHSNVAKQQFVDCIALPHVTSLLSGLQSQHPVYAVTARLLKRWAGVHLLSSFLPEPVTDLIAAHLFVSPKPFQVPRCPMVAFHRCLYLITHHDWANEPLILNFNEEINADAVSELMVEFRTRRLKFPCAAIVTPTDRESLLSRRVMPFMLKLVRQLAAKCLHAAEEHLAVGEFHPVPLVDASFKPDLSAMDVLIELRSERSRRVPFTLKQDAKKVNLLVDPAGNYIKHIEESYGDKAVIMYDINNTKYIGLIWKPGAFSPVPAKRACEERLRSARALTHIDTDVCVKLDIEALLQDLNFAGKEIVANITVQSTPSDS